MGLPPSCVFVLMQPVPRSHFSASLTAQDQGEAKRKVLLDQKRGDTLFVWGLVHRELSNRAPALHSGITLVKYVGSAARSLATRVVKHDYREKFQPNRSRCTNSFGWENVVKFSHPNYQVEDLTGCKFLHSTVQGVSYTCN